MSYDQLDDVQNGMVAMKRLLDLITDKIPQEQREQTIINLLKYCGQDSLAMVKIFEEIKKVI
jgi:Ca2+-binding EF-hand superfamily protein